MDKPAVFPHTVFGLITWSRWPCRRSYAELKTLKYLKQIMSDWIENNLKIFDNHVQSNKQRVRVKVYDYNLGGANPRKRLES